MFPAKQKYGQLLLAGTYKSVTQKQQKTKILYIENYRLPEGFITSEFTCGVRVKVICGSVKPQHG